MKLFDSIGPNPKVVRMFMAERGIQLDTEKVDILAGDNRKDAYLRRNPSGTLPCLELDDGSFLAEILPVCEYLEEWAGASSLIGETPEERAETRMWARRLDLGICEPMANGFRYSEGKQMFEARMRVIPQAADDLKALAQEKLSWLDAQMEGKTFICGDRFTLADILLYGFLEFGAQVGQPLNEENGNLVAWFNRIKARASAVV